MSEKLDELTRGRWMSLQSPDGSRQAFFGELAFEMYSWKLQALRDRDKRILQLEEQLRRARDLRDLLSRPGVDP